MNKKEKNSFSRKVCMIRLDTGMTQPELARLMNVSVRTVSGWETGDRPPRHAERLLEEIKRATKTKDKNINDPTINTNPKGEEEDTMLQNKLIEALQKIVERDEMIFLKDAKIEELESKLKKVTPSSKVKTKKA